MKQMKIKSIFISFSYQSVKKKKMLLESFLGILLLHRLAGKLVTSILNNHRYSVTGRDG